MYGNCSHFCRCPVFGGCRSSWRRCLVCPRLSWVAARLCGSAVVPWAVCSARLSALLVWGAWGRSSRLYIRHGSAFVTRKEKNIYSFFPHIYTTAFGGSAVLWGSAARSVLACPLWRLWRLCGRRFLLWCFYMAAAFIRF